MNLKSIAALAFLAQAPYCLAGPTNVDPPETESIGADTEIKVVSPTNTFYGTRGLSQTASAEALGEGRLIFGLQGAFYQQQKDFPGGPNKDANIFTGIGSVSLGINRQIDAFASLSGFGSTDYSSRDASGLGSLGGGIQGTLPFEPTTPFRMAAQVGIYQGFSQNAINFNHADGYNYFETRTGLDFMAKLIQSLVLGNESQAFKMHFNEGLVTSAEDGKDALLLFAAGAQCNISHAVLGLEFNARTPINEIDIASDPLWMTPSVQFRTAYDLNFTVGGDIALSKDRETPDRALEPYRLFAAMAFTFDTEAAKRQRTKDKARKEALEKGQLKNDNKYLADNLVKQSREDSLAQLRQKETSDSAAAVLAEKARKDSLQMAAKSHQDSLALLDSQRKLAEEKAKRSEAEKQLLSTGLLLMDAVYFETNKTDISINSKPYLNIIAKMLTKYPKLQIEVSGHTDDVGSDARNLTLSQGRSESVTAYMVQAAPELRNVLSAKGYGESQPKADNKTADGRKLNRRTELQVLNKDALKEYNP
jgi:outer membrane protein OmpA-like peptidoglycan-associated protein